MVLARSRVKQFYDRFGSKQDAQSFYEDVPLDELIEHGEFGQAQSVFEFGCGTGRLAARLLETHLPAGASYRGVDLSQTMTGIARQRLSAWAGRAAVTQTDGEARFPLPDHSVDRGVSTYVLDLLPEAEMRRVIAEAHRVLRPGGRLCLASLTRGETTASRLVCGLWNAVFRLRPVWIGGCRPVRLAPLLDPQAWSVVHHHVVIQFGVPSEVLIARPDGGARHRPARAQ